MTLRELSHQKLLGDLAYWRKEYAMKQQLLTQIERRFRAHLSQRHPELLPAPSPAPPAVSTTQAVVVRELAQPEPILPSPRTSVDPTLKHVYREIVKRTHPDKTREVPVSEQPRLHKLYVAATLAYERADELALLLYARRLRLPVPLDGVQAQRIAAEITQLRQRSQYVEATLPWRWYYAAPAERRQLVDTLLKKS